jgi:hypothetical protein
MTTLRRRLVRALIGDMMPSRYAKPNWYARLCALSLRPLAMALAATTHSIVLLAMMGAGK